MISSTKRLDMANSVMTIPRFLLPQLSWKSGFSRLPGPLSSSNAHEHTHVSVRYPCQSRALHGSQSATLFANCRRQLQSRSRLGIIAQDPSRHFSSTSSLKRDHHFDTLKFVQRLRGEGFSEEQSRAMMLVLSDVIEESIQNLTRTMVLKEGG